MEDYLQINNSTCDFCDKFLSIKPVKVYPDQKKRCGRCPDENKDLLTEKNTMKFVFPCINCYDGCMELLTTDNAEEHEKTCEINDYACPLCGNDTMIPSYRMRNHFQNFHEDNLLLGSAAFKVYLSEPMGAGKWFLYDTRHKIFFINVGYIESSETYFVSAGCLGNWGEKQVYRRITLHYGNEQLVSEVTSCRPYTEMKSEFVVNKAVVAEEKSFVVFVAFLFPEKEDQTVLPIRNAALMLSSSEYPEWRLAQNRNIKLDVSLRGKFNLPTQPPFDHFLSADGSRKLYPHCLLCGQNGYSKCRLTNNYVFFYQFSSSEFSLCSFCKSVYVGPVLDKVSKLRMSQQNYHKIGIECIWKNCGKYCTPHDIERHNSTCIKQPVRSCPVSYCKFEGALHEMPTHFHENHHPLVMVPYAFLIALLGLKCPPINIYLLVRNAFVFVNLKYVEPEWRIKFSLCGDKFTFGGKKLKAAAFEKYSKRFLAMCEAPDVLKVKPRTLAFIRCFLE